MNPASLLLLGFALSALGAIVATGLRGEDARWAALAGSTLALGLFVVAALGWPVIDEPAAAFGILPLRADRLTLTVSLAVAVCATSLALGLPRGRARPMDLAGIVGAVPATGLALAVVDLRAAAAVEVLALVALAIVAPTRAARGSVALAAALVAAGAAAWMWAAPEAAAPPVITVGAWLVAVVLRLGVWPLTGPLVDALERADGAGAVALALPVGGLAIVVRSAHETAGLWSGTGALVTVVLGCALVAALLSSVQGPWRRGLGYALSALHALLFAACLDATEAGFLGGELLWSGVLVASSGAMLSVMVVEARTGPLDLSVWHGLHDRMRFLSALTLVFALGAAGLPGSIVFIAEELLLSGSASDGAIGAILVLSTLAAIGYNLVRMHFHVFFGPPTVPGAARALDHLDATGRERAAMLLLVLPLFGAGLAPRTVPLLGLGEGAAPADERGAPEPAALP